MTHYIRRLELDRQMQALLAERASDLLKARATQTGMRPKALLQQAIPEASPSDLQRDAIVKQLLKRLGGGE